MAEDRHYAGDYEVEVIADCGTDITDCESCCIWFRRPSGVTGMWSGTTYALSGATNYVYYTTNAGDMDNEGIWKFQSGVTFTRGFTGRGKTHKELIYPAHDVWD